MPSDKPSNSGNTTLVTIVVAIITTVGVITAAYIGSHHSPDQGGKQSVQGADQESKPKDQTPPARGNDDPRPALQPVMGALQENIGLMGGTDYESLHLDRAADCSERCRNESKCVAMTFTPDQTCWLKYQVTQAVPAQGMTSAIKTHQ
jgi:hypothetical protein